MTTFNEIDKLSLAAYEEFSRDQDLKACEIWGSAWVMFCEFIDGVGITSISEFDQRFHCSELVVNWTQEYEQALCNAGRSEARFFEIRIAYCEEFLRRFESTSDELVVQNMRRAISESYFILGQRDKAEALMAEWLVKDPRWGWGWISWADCWHFETEGEEEDLEKAIEILNRGLEIPDVADKEYLFERMSELYHDLCMPKEEELWDEMRRDFLEYEESRKKHEATMARCRQEPQKQLNVQAVSLKVGRNDPCPCGSGKKFKKCCGQAG
jgi:tetratricopeptide (TPR) repeat protein